jgi:CheY-like chemotaxis protein
VLLNLVSNALQYTQEGTVLVDCRPATADAQARIEVWDSGVGIAPEHHDKVFDEFFQVSNPERDRSKGLGLGLSMVTRACQFLGHPLQMRSALGCGTRFTLWVPTTPAQTVATPDETDQATGTLCDGAGLDPLKVWLIEDDLLGCTALTGLLKSWGCQVAVADSAMGAMDLVRQGMCPDFVVSDYRLRGEHDGIEAVHMVREALGTEVAACLISGDTDADLRQQVQQAGLVLLQKPVRPAKLRSVLRHAVRNV